MTNEAYSPATAGSRTLASLLSRLDRYLTRHGSPYGETPIPADSVEDVRQSILADWWGDDWTAREWKALERTGRALFGPTLSDTGRHLRALLFHAGRARRRGWRSDGAARRVADRRRDSEDFDGSGMCSRAADPARIMAAVEAVSGELVLSPAAARERSRRGLPLRYRGGVSIVPDDAPVAVRIMRRRGRTGVTIDVVARHDDRTSIEIREYREHRFERVGKVPRRALVRSRLKLPAGVTAADCRAAIG